MRAALLMLLAVATRSVRAVRLPPTRAALVGRGRAPAAVRAMCTPIPTVDPETGEPLSKSAIKKLQKQAAMDLLLETNEHKLAHCRAQLAREERLGRRRSAAQTADAQIVGRPSLLLAGPRGTVGVAPAAPGGMAAVPMLWGLS